MITEDLIRFDLPNLDTKPKLYAKVKANQIYICNSKYESPATPRHTCKKGFSYPFSLTTYYRIIMIFDVIFINLLNLKISKYFLIIFKFY